MPPPVQVLPPHLKNQAVWCKQYFDTHPCKGALGCPAREDAKKGQGPHPVDVKCKILNDKGEPCGTEYHFPDMWRAPISAYDHLKQIHGKIYHEEVANYLRAPGQVQQAPLPTDPIVTVSPLVRWAWFRQKRRRKGRSADRPCNTKICADVSQLPISTAKS